MRIENWGFIPYREAWSKQKNIYDHLISDTDASEIIAICEHPDVYTLGVHGDVSNLLTTPKSEVEVIRIERGGDITYHGPGQLVVYPLVDLKRHKIGVKQYVELLERSVRETLEEYGIVSSSNDSQIGVWLDWGKTSARKICAIGVKISHGVTMHGLALNVNTDLSAFSLINPCGITDKAVTSMATELGYRLQFDEVAEVLTKHIYSNINKNS